MKAIKHQLAAKEIDFSIKRGEKPSQIDISIKNDIFAQIFYSFVYQKPGTARSNKNSLFNNNKTYNQIFKVKLDGDYVDFITDLILLNKRFDEISQKIKNGSDSPFSDIESIVFSNSKLAIFALFGVVYRLVNNDVVVSDLDVETNLDGEDFIYSKFISNYIADDIDELLEQLIIYLVQIIEEEYSNLFEANKVSSISNFLKLDSKYNGNIINSFLRSIRRQKYFDEMIDYGRIFVRK